MMAPVAFVNHITTKAVLHLAQIGADEVRVCLHIHTY